MQAKCTLILLAVVFVAGCGPCPANDSSPTLPGASPTSTVALPTPTEQPSTPTPLPTDPLAASPEVHAAMADLTARLDISAEQIIVVSVESVQWQDSSLGCPQPGMMYAQVITPGYRIVLEAEGTLFEYHTAKGRDGALLCKSRPAAAPDNPQFPLLTPTPGDHTQ